MLFDHLVSAAAADYVPELYDSAPAFVPMKALSGAQMLDAQVKTSAFLEGLTKNDAEIINEAEKAHAEEAFKALITGSPDIHERLLKLEVPQAVQNAISMVSSYQWHFVEQAKELRSMAVAKIVTETEHPDARIRLRALELLGKVTEVALFTDRVEVKRTQMTEEELDAQLLQRMARVEKYMGKVDVVENNASAEGSGDEE